MMTEFPKIMLLTGAGFTKNFGGFSAAEMWAQIYNHDRIQESDYLRELLKNDFDFESVYSKIVDDPATLTEDKNRIQDAVVNAYKNLDNAIKGWSFVPDNPYPVCWSKMNDLLNLFNITGRTRGLWFTLNQDIFMERQSGSVSPCVPPFLGTVNVLHAAPFSERDFVELPRNITDELIKKAMDSHVGPAYIKLHGSYGWKAADGSARLVIGQNKSSLIEREPLLKTYFNLFQSALSSGNKKILVIGYGFRDKHINDVLAQAVRSAGLKIYVISTSSPEKWKSIIMQDVVNGFEILNGLAGYFPYSLLEMFPMNFSETTHFHTLRTALLK